MRRLLRVAVRWARGFAGDLARQLLGSRRTRRFIWARWAQTRLTSLMSMRRLYRRVVVEWDVPGHGRAVTSEIVGPDRNEVLVRTMISVVDPHGERADFRRETSAQFPMVPGFSLAGEVVAVGRSVSSLRVGQTVATRGPHASLVVRPADLVFPLPAGRDVTRAAFLYFGMAALSAFRTGDLSPGERVAVIGRSAMSQMVVQVARALGASEVFIAEDEGVEPPLEAVGADLTVEASGAESAWLHAIRATRPGGRVVLIFEQPPQEFDQSSAQGVSVLVSDGLSPGSPTYRNEAEGFLDLIQSGLSPPEGLVEIHPWEAGRFYKELAGTRREWVTALYRWDLLPDDERVKTVRWWEPPETDLARGMTMRSLPVAEMVRSTPQSRLEA